MKCIISKPLDNNLLNAKYWTWQYEGQIHLTNTKTNKCYRKQHALHDVFQVFTYEFGHNCDIKDIGG
jgi:hypothetical protein